MTKKKSKKKSTSVEDGFTVALRAIDNQIAREMQRSPLELEQHGVSKSEPHMKRIEQVTAVLLNAFGSRQVQLDSLLVASQAFTKALRFVAEELGPEALGQVRGEYCEEAFEQISSDAFKALQLLKTEDRLI